MRQTGLLAALGLSPAEESLWQAMVDRPPVTIAELAELNGGNGRALIASLEAKGLVIRTSGRPVRYTVTVPDVALEVLIRAKEEKLQQVRLQTEQLMRRYRAGHRTTAPEDVIEVVLGAEAVLQHCRQINRAASKEVCNLSTPPFLTVPDPSTVDPVPAGMIGRTVYDASVLELPGWLSVMEELVRKGEQVRIGHVPVKLLLGDDRIGMIALNFPPTSDAVLIVHSSSLLVALRALFEAVWVTSVPIIAPDNGKDHRQLLTFLAAGMTDQAIARQLGWHLSTVQRKVRRLMAELGVRTRFQAGLQAARRGWL